MDKRIIIIDGNSLINRAYYAMQRPMITKEGIYTQGIYGFLNMLNKIMDDYAPDYITVAWDRKAPTFRHEEYKEYKAGRKKMPPELAMEMPLMKDILNAMKIVSLEIDGFEADDIIGTVARISEENGLNPLIITGDKDALQLATDKTHILITKKGISEFDLYDREKMIERYQLTPEQFIDLKGLMGDQSDNIPGLPGVGEKTGIKLLTQFGSVSNLLANTDQIVNEKLRIKVEENAQLAAMSRRLATINKFVPIEVNMEDLKVEEIDYNELRKIYTKLEFNSFLKKLDGAGKGQSQSENIIDGSQFSRIQIDNMADISKLEELNTESTAFIKVFSDNNHIDIPVIMAVSILQKDKYYFIKLENHEMVEGLIAILNNKKLQYAGYNLKPDYFALMCHGLFEVNTAFDIAVAEYVLDPSVSKLKEEKKDIDNKEEYGLRWCIEVQRITEQQKNDIAENNLDTVLYQVEFPLIEVLAAMETQGFTVDKDTLDSIGEKLKEQLAQMEQSIYTMAGTEFNINSPIQLAEVLFEKLELPAGKKTKRGYSTSADVLEKLRDKHPIIDLILQYRTLSKLNSTYVEGLRPLIGFDGKIRAHFQQTVTATGRISCTEPNLQNIPIRQELGRQLRKAFTADDDKSILIGADYSQIELRILAHLSGDENLIQSFNNGDDIHRNTAARVFELDYDKVTSLDRSRAKAVNFGVIYGMSGFGLSEELKITRKQAENYINEYFEKHEAVKKYMDDQVNFCRENGFSLTILGRKRFIREINSSNYMTRQLGERLAMNSPIQGSAADVIKIAMVKVYNELKRNNYKSKLILQVHDELIIDTVEDETEQIKKLLSDNMESAMSLKVVLESDMNTGKTWYDLK